MKPLSQNEASIPLAKAFHTSQLSGWVSKKLDIPAGRKGLVLFQDGRIRQTGSGQQTLLQISERLRGLGAGLRAAFYPAQPFQAWLRAANLLSGDQELVDCSLLCRLQVSNPSVFLEELLWPLNEIQASGLELSDDAFSQVMNAFTARYAASDLVSGLVGERLLSEIMVLLSPVLSAKGLQLEAVDLLVFQRTADRATVAQKVQEIQLRLKDIELEGQMASIENQAHLEDFVEQINQELGQSGSVRLSPSSQGKTGAESGPQDPAERSAWFENIQEWLQNELKGLPQPWRLSSLWQKSPVVKQPTPLATPSNWWLRRFIWIIFLLVAGFLASRYILYWSAEVGWKSPWGLISLVWMLVIGGLFDSLKYLVVHREKLYENMFKTQRSLSLYDLAQTDRSRLEQLVRQQLNSDLLHSRDVLNDLRSQLYRQGQEQAALRLKSLESKFEHQAANLQRSDISVQDFLAQAKIKRGIWEQWLGNDEALLARSAALANDAQAVHQAFYQDSFTPQLLDRLESNLDALMHTFESRKRVFQAAPEIIAGYTDPQIHKAG